MVHAHSDGPYPIVLYINIDLNGLVFILFLYSANENPQLILINRQLDRWEPVLNPPPQAMGVPIRCEPEQI